ETHGRASLRSVFNYTQLTNYSIHKSIRSGFNMTFPCYGINEGRSNDGTIGMLANFMKRFTIANSEACDCIR
nr:hypothetical protein [Salinivirgaceae bacterium]